MRRGRGRAVYTATEMGYLWSWRIPRCAFRDGEASFHVMSRRRLDLGVRRAGHERECDGAWLQAGFREHDDPPA